MNKDRLLQKNIYKINFFLFNWNYLFCIFIINFEYKEKNMNKIEKKNLREIKIEIDDYLTKDISVDPISISRFYFLSVKYHQPCWIILTA